MNEQINSQEYYRKLRESWKVYLKNKFNLNMVQDDEKIEMMKKELSICKDNLDYTFSSNIPNKQEQFEQILITKNHIYFNFDNEIKSY